MNKMGYQMIYCFEILLRKFIVEKVDTIGKEYSDEAIENIKRSNKDIIKIENISLANRLEYLHLGQLLDIISTSEFRKKHENDVYKFEAIKNCIISIRNDIMHSRILFESEIEDLQDYIIRLLDALKDRKYKAEFNNSIREDFNSLKTCIPFINYPLGKDFTKLIGRNNDINRILDDLKYPNPVTIAGMGGLGKSAIVIQIIEDIVVSRNPSFNKIFFMSFKDSYYDGYIHSLSKPINDYDELIIRLANINNIDTLQIEEEELEKVVFNCIFDEPTLLVLDNLETEVINSNLNKFINLAREYTKNYTKQSRLIITSRNGLGQIESKYDLATLNKEDTLELLCHSAEKKIKILKDQWPWIDTYCEGNPLQIKTLGIVLKEDSLNLTDLISEYLSTRGSLSKKLFNQKEAFLSFCFDNTIITLKHSDQVLFTIICELCSRIQVYQLNRQFFDFTIDHLGLSQYGVEEFEPNNLTRLTLLYFDSDSCGYDYKVNMSALQYLIHGKKEARHFNKYDLMREKELYSKVNEMIIAINEIIHHSSRVPTIIDILGQLYLNKYNLTKHDVYLEMAFRIKPNLDMLIRYITNNKDILSSLHLINHLPSRELFELNNENISNQNRFIHIVLKELLYDKTLPIYQLKEKYDMLLKFTLMTKNKNQLKLPNKIILCKLLLKLKDPQDALNYLNEVPDKIRFEVYSKLAEEARKTNNSKADEYFNKCKSILDTGGDINLFEKCRYYLYYGKHIHKDNPEEAILILRKLDGFNASSVMILSFKLEALIVRGECYYRQNDFKSLASIIKSIKELEKVELYDDLYTDKKAIFNKRICALKKYNIDMDNKRILAHQGNM